MQNPPKKTTHNFLILSSAAVLYPPAVWNTLLWLLSLQSPPSSRYPVCSDWSAHTCLSQHCPPCLHSALSSFWLPLSFTLCEYRHSLLMKVSFNSDMSINLNISNYVFTIYHDAYYIFSPSFEKYKMWNKFLEEENAENIHAVSLEVCDGLQFAARIQLNLSLFHCFISQLPQAKKKMERKCLTNHISCLRLPPKWKVTRGHLFKKQPLIREPCCDEVSWQHGPSWKKCGVLYDLWSSSQGGSTVWHLGMDVMRGETQNTVIFPLLFIWYQVSVYSSGGIILQNLSEISVFGKWSSSHLLWISVIGTHSHTGLNYLLAKAGYCLSQRPCNHWNLIDCR